MTEPALIHCPECGALVSDVEGPTYGTGAPGCWAVFGEITGREFSDPAYRAHRRSPIDAYAVQHPGSPSPRASKSAWVHLVGLCLVVERRFPVDAAVRAIAGLASGAPAFPWLEPPVDRGSVTVIDVAAEVDVAAHVRAMQRWADSAWGAWAQHHPAIRRRADELLDSA
jgi:hypothetical protein